MSFGLVGNDDDNGSRDHVWRKGDPLVFIGIVLVVAAAAALALIGG